MREGAMKQEVLIFLGRQVEETLEMVSRRETLENKELEKKTKKIKEMLKSIGNLKRKGDANVLY